MPKIEKINGFWVPSNDVHLDQWRDGKPFTQNKCLLKFIEYCETENKKLWNFYVYYVLALIVIILLIVTGFIWNCCKKKNK